MSKEKLKDKLSNKTKSKITLKSRREIDLFPDKPVIHVNNKYNTK